MLHLLKFSKRSASVEIFDLVNLNCVMRSSAYTTQLSLKKENGTQSSVISHQSSLSNT